MPPLKFPEITLRCPGAVPPMTVPFAVARMPMPLLPRAVTPSGSSPMKLPWMTALPEPLG